MAKPTAKQRREWQKRVTAMPTAADIADCIECWPEDWQDKFAFHNGQVATLLAEAERLRAREAALVEIVRWVAEASESHTTPSEYLQVSRLHFSGVGAAGWLRQQARALLAAQSAQADGDPFVCPGCGGHWRRDELGPQRGDLRCSNCGEFCEPEQQAVPGEA